MDYWSPCSSHAGNYQWHLHPVKSRCISPSTGWPACTIRAPTQTQAQNTKLEITTCFTTNKRALCYGYKYHWMTDNICLLSCVIITLDFLKLGLIDGQQVAFTCTGSTTRSLYSMLSTQVELLETDWNAHHMVLTFGERRDIPGTTAECWLADMNIWLLIDTYFILVQCFHWGVQCEGLGVGWQGFQPVKCPLSERRFHEGRHKLQQLWSGRQKV